MKIYASILIAALCVSTAYAENASYSSATQIATIPQLDIDGKPGMKDIRLKLRPDALLELVGYTPIVQPTGGKGKWLFEETSSAVTGAKTSVIWVGGELSSTNYLGDYPTLVIRCNNKKTEAYINFRAFLGSKNTSIAYKIGDNAFKNESWNLSTDGTALFAPANSAQAFALSLLNNAKFAAEAQSFSNGKMTGIFDITGIENAISPVRQECGW